MSIWNFVLSWVEHEKSFITLGQGQYGCLIYHGLPCLTPCLWDTVHHDWTGPLTLKASPIICSRRQFQILPLFQNSNMARYFIRFSYNIIPYFCRKLGKMSQNLSSAAVMIGALRVKRHFISSAVWMGGFLRLVKEKLINWDGSLNLSFNYWKWMQLCC